MAATRSERSEGRPPLVAVPAYHLPAHQISRWKRSGFALPETYVLALRAAGVRVAILPTIDEAPEEVLAPFDGLLLAGGGDVDPARYGQERHPMVYGVDPVRDALETALVCQALEQGIPTLAICRGLQVLNVACGGSLAQHLPDGGGPDIHNDPNADGVGVHAIDLAPGSRLAEAVGATHVPECVSHHHQGVDRVGEGLVPVGWAPDGLVEALEPAPGSGYPGWMAAVQWHPEASSTVDAAQQAVFTAFAHQVGTGLS